MALGFFPQAILNLGQQRHFWPDEQIKWREFLPRAIHIKRLNRSICPDKVFQ